jgi:hypothetical protein
MSNTRTIAVLLIGFLVCGSISWATERTGAQVAVSLKSGSETRGELMAVKKDFLVLSSSSLDKVSDQSVPVADVRAVKIVRRSKVGTGALIGLLAGAGGGALLGLAAGNDDPGFFSLSATDKAGILAAFFGLVGVAVGSIAGAATGVDTSFGLENQSAKAVQETLGLLSRSARIQGIQ